MLTPEIDALITALPKAELYIHLTGSMRPATLLILAQSTGIDLGSMNEADLHDLYHYQDFRHFLELHTTLELC